MSKKIHSSGNIDSKSDFYIEYKSDSSQPVKINIESNTFQLHKTKLNQVINTTLKDLEVKNGQLSITDNGGQYFVLQARIEAVIKSAFPELKNESLPALQKHSNYTSKKNRFRRSRLYLPGNQAKLMLNAGIHNPDGIILDLEDSVSPLEKNAARLIVRNALIHIDFFNAERMVRINQGKAGIEDLKMIIPHNVHLILVPKVEEVQQLIDIDNQIQLILNKVKHTKQPVFLMPIIESAKGLLNSVDIAKASPNNVAIAIGLEDYTADIGVERTNSGTESLFARSQIVNAAKAAGIQAIDTVFSDVNDETALRKSVIEAKSLGFDGKGCIHPRQIKPIHEEFAPSVIEINKAKDIVLAFDEAQKKGLGVVAIGSKMIDPPIVLRAQNTIELAINTGLLSRTWKKD